MNELTPEREKELEAIEKKLGTTFLSRALLNQAAGFGFARNQTGFFQKRDDVQGALARAQRNFIDLIGKLLGPKQFVKSAFRSFRLLTTVIKANDLSRQTRFGIPRMGFAIGQIGFYFLNVLFFQIGQIPQVTNRERIGNRHQFSEHFLGGILNRNVIA